MKNMSELNSYQALFEYIRPRPAMYLGYRSIIALDAFVTGWSVGKTGDIEDGGLLQEFSKWLAQQHGITSSQNWARIIHFYSQDDVDALDNFFDSYDRFLRERSGPPGGPRDPR
jgi:hypothetical protein